MSKHTPGPWEAYLCDDTVAVGFADRAGEAPCIVNWPGFDSCDLPLSQRKANARLIAAAPDLLEACKEFCRKVEAGEAKSTRSYAQMKAAIAKAEGKDDARLY